jgi:hypothetical protein
MKSQMSRFKRGSDLVTFRDSAPNKNSETVAKLSLIYSYFCFYTYTYIVYIHVIFIVAFHIFSNINLIFNTLLNIKKDIYIYIYIYIVLLIRLI